MNLNFIIKLKKVPAYVWIVFFIQLLLIESICFDQIGYSVPLIRQIVGFVYLTFIPGALIIQCFNLRDLGKIKYLLYSIGISISFVMFLGFITNSIYPLIGINNPISVYPLLLTINLFVLFLCTVSYKFNPHRPSFSRNLKVLANYLYSIPNLFLLLLPFIGIFGALTMYLFNNNILSLLLILFMTLVIYLIVDKKFIPSTSYPLAIFFMSIALLWNNSLISYELTGYDIFWEFFRQDSVIINSIWDYQISQNVNGMLSTVMLAPIYSLLLDLDSTWVFKIIYPIFFSLVPLSLFQIYREQTNDLLATLSTFFFMSLQVFFSEMIQLPRQQIAELFIVLSVLLFMDKNMNSAKKAILSVVFLFSIVVSHYGTSYLYLLYLCLTFLFLIVFQLPYVHNLYTAVICKKNIFVNCINIPSNLRSNNIFFDKCGISFNYVILFIIFCLGWYIYISSGSIFDSALQIMNHIYSSIMTDFFSLDSRDQQMVQALGLSSMRSVELTWKIALIFQYITQLFILIGMFRLFTDLKKTVFHIEFVFMSFASLVLIGLCVVLPNFSTALNMSRIYHLTLLFLSPFFFLGGSCFFSAIWIKVFHIKFANFNFDSFLKLTTVFVLIPYFLFTTGFVFDVTNSTTTSMSLSLYDQDSMFYTIPEIQATRWFDQNGMDNYPIYSDGRISPLLLKTTRNLSTFSLSRISFFDNRSFSPNNKAYSFLRRWHLITGKVLKYQRQGGAPILVNLNEIDLLTSHKWGTIYNNGESQFLYKDR